MSRRRRIVPRAPEGVRVLRPDGSQVPVELAYVGKRDGIDLWRVTGRINVEDELCVDVLPGHSGIVVEVNGP